MALSEIDRNLLDRCLSRKPGAWEDFVDRFMGLVVHVINHTAHSRSMRLAQQDREDLCAEVFLAVVRDDFSILRHFRGQSSLATYLTVIARRVVVRELLQRKTTGRLTLTPTPESPGTHHNNGGGAEQQLGDREEIERLMSELDGSEADVVRMFHLEGKSYQEISEATGLAENSIGPTLSRAREKMRRAGANLS